MTQELLDECVKEAIKLGRKYMDYPSEDNIHPTSDEWLLALVLFQDKLRKEEK